MKTIRIVSYPELRKLFSNHFSSRIGNTSREGGEMFLHSIGYKSAKWVPGTYQYSLSDADYTWFILRWGHEKD